MPSHKIHIKVAELVNKEFNFNQELFLIGSVLPDLSETIPHYQSHFKTIPNNHLFYDKDLFINKYLADKNPVLLGYLVHLLTDEFYNSNFKKYRIFDENDKFIGLKMKDGNNYYSDANELCLIKQKEFSLYDLYLLTTEEFPLFSNSNITNGMPKIEECDYDNNYIYEYIDTYNNMVKEYKNKSIKIDYKVMTQDELDKLFNDCVNYVINYLKNIM